MVDLNFQNYKDLCKERLPDGKVIQNFSSFKLSNRHKKLHLAINSLKVEALFLLSSSFHFLNIHFVSRLCYTIDTITLQDFGKALFVGLIVRVLPYASVLKRVLYEFDLHGTESVEKHIFM